MRRLALILLLSAAPVLSAQTTVGATLTCPIGGKPFEYKAAAVAKVPGTRPDGKPLGVAAFPPPLPECPDNGLVLYKEYDPAEVAKLEPLVASEAYQALRKEDVSYYRAYWLMKEMGVDPQRRLSALLQAGWQADDRPELRARYLAEFAAETEKIEVKASDLDRVGMEGQAINALRELGRFDEALARLGKLPSAALAPSAGNSPEASRRRAWAAYFKNLRTVTERKDSSAEPLEMLPRRIALARCLDLADKVDEAQRAFCAADSAAVEELRAARAKDAVELEILRKKGSSGR